MIFNKEYNKYWKNRVEKSIDGTKVPNNEIVKELISHLGIESSDCVLDLGCGFGRIFPILGNLTSTVFGIDIDLSMINDASKFPYTSLHRATAEDTAFPDAYFNKIFSMGVFDVVRQEDALIELNRILKDGGTCGFTGKNIAYHEDDTVAFIAERNAKLKDFPNQFTDVKKLIANIDQFGFKVKKLIIFPKRGDMGESNCEIVDKLEEQKFYEYCIFLEKTQPIVQFPGISFTSEYSDTSRNRSLAAGFNSVIDFFERNKEG